jgi:hypothetical protein
MVFIGHINAYLNHILGEFHLLLRNIPYILEFNVHLFYSFRGPKMSDAYWIRGRDLDFGKMIEPLYMQ